ncbi:GNAT family N-acetyltransferase [Ruania alba]|uniref:Predicted N-acyltransferase, GNAT family n=1 Tax=Ruania alba TaxID=648782 RepID=A0A1H5EAW5_9MICO|nr:GNAT family N-acetyltransferase [Ruania alba]SED88251.1 Predicted N-acyltransferase, GNAT family [Ruania alba]
MAEVQVVRAGPEDLARVHAIRFEVFVTEQGVAESDELDDRDGEPGTVHLLAVSTGDGVRSPGGFEATEDLGTARLLDDGGVAHVSRVAVRSAARGLGVGRALMEALEREALAAHAARAPDGVVRVELSAQETAIAFYAALGYEVGSERYTEAGIWHRDAVKLLHVDGS